MAARPRARVTKISVRALGADAGFCHGLLGALLLTVGGVSAAHAQEPPEPPGADSLEVVPDSVLAAFADSIPRRAQSFPERLTGLRGPTQEIFDCDRECVHASPSFTLLELLLEHVPGITGVRGEFYQGPHHVFDGGFGPGFATLYIDGREVLSLSRAQADLRRVSLNYVDRVRVYRGADGLVIDVDLIRHDGVQAYSRVSGLTGDPRSEILDAVFANSLGGASNVEASFERYDVQDRQNDQNRFAVQGRFSWMPRSNDFGVQFEYRSENIERTGLDTLELTRRGIRGPDAGEPRAAGPDRSLRAGHELQGSRHRRPGQPCAQAGGGWRRPAVLGAAGVGRDLDGPPLRRARRLRLAPRGSLRLAAHRPLRARGRRGTRELERVSDEVLAGGGGLPGDAPVSDRTESVHRGGNPGRRLPPASHARQSRDIGIPARGQRAVRLPRRLGGPPGRAVQPRRPLLGAVDGSAGRLRRPLRPARCGGLRARWTSRRWKCASTGRSCRSAYCFGDVSPIRLRASWRKFDSRGAETLFLPERLFRTELYLSDTFFNENLQIWVSVFIDRRGARLVPVPGSPDPAMLDADSWMGGHLMFKIADFRFFWRFGNLGADQTRRLSGGAVPPAAQCVRSSLGVLQLIGPGAADRPDATSGRYRSDSQHDRLRLGDRDAGRAGRSRLKRAR